MYSVWFMLQGMTFREEYDNENEARRRFHELVADWSTERVVVRNGHSEIVAEMNWTGIVR